MKTSAILVNTSRGPVVNQAALLKALQAGQIAGAGLDVTDPEPMRADNPLLALPQVIVLPHVGSATRALAGVAAAEPPFARLAPPRSQAGRVARAMRGD